jgi:hypothetical protein
MLEDFRKLEFSNETHRPATLDELVMAYVQHYALSYGRGRANEKDQGSYFWASECANDFARSYPEWCWRFVLAVLTKRPSIDLMCYLAAGELEGLLAKHGSLVIDRVEKEARTSESFRILLSGVWKSSMPDEIWQRIQKAAS